MAAEPAAVPLGADAPIFEVMRTMRAMRRLKPDPVPDELLDQIVEAATWAPSGGNLQGYHYVVVTDREVMASLAELWRDVSTFYLDTIATVVPEGMTEEKYEKLRAALRFQRDHFAETPAIIVPCYDTGRWTRALRAKGREFAGRLRAEGAGRAAVMLRSAKRSGDMAQAASVYPGVQNMLLAARSLGLGATLTTWHLFVEPEFKKVLGIPKNVQTYAVIPIGWPRGNFGPVVRRPAADRVHRDRW
jgi:nitroreductase